MASPYTHSLVYNSIMLFTLKKEEKIFSFKTLIFSVPTKREKKTVCKIFSIFTLISYEGTFFVYGFNKSNKKEKVPLLYLFNAQLLPRVTKVILIFFSSFFRLTNNYYLNWITRILTNSSWAGLH